MRLSRQTNLAVRMLLFCASNGDRLSQVARIADAYSVSAMHLAQILKPLVDAGMIDTVRGRHGGIRLGRSASAITLGDVVRAMETSMTGRQEANALGEPDTAELALEAAFNRFLEILDGYTIADVANGMPFLREIMKVA